MMCCVNPDMRSFEHSLPAIKFCARIRDCIVKRLSKKDSENVNTSNMELQSKGIIVKSLKLDQI